MGWEAIRIARLIKSAKHCIVFTGAGISTAAGVGDYRGKSGKWTSHDLNDFINDCESTYCFVVSSSAIRISDL